MINNLIIGVISQNTAGGGGGLDPGIIISSFDFTGPFDEFEFSSFNVNSQQVGIDSTALTIVYNFTLGYCLHTFNSVIGQSYECSVTLLGSASQFGASTALVAFNGNDQNGTVLGTTPITTSGVTSLIFNATSGQTTIGIANDVNRTLQLDVFEIITT